MAVAEREHAAVEVVDLETTPLRELNQRLHDLARTARDCIATTLSRRSAAGRAAPAGTGASSTRAARTPSPAGSTPRSRSRSTVTWATTAPG